MYPGGTGHEIDVTEFFGAKAKRSGLFSYIHRYEGGRVVKTGTTIPDTFLHGPRDGWGKNFHVFSVQWTPRSLIFRIDGKETWRIGGRISRVPQYLILSLLSVRLTKLPQIQDRQLPQHMYVDWVRGLGEPGALSESVRGSRRGPATVRAHPTLIVASPSASLSAADGAPPVGFEPTLPPPEGGALSPELRGPRCGVDLTGGVGRRRNRGAISMRGGPAGADSLAR